MSDESFALTPPDQGESGPYALAVTIYAKPGMAERLEEKLLALVGPTRSEAGSLAYHLHRDRADPEKFFLYEIWKDVAALEAHLKEPYLTAFFAEQETYVRHAERSWLKMSSHFS